MKKVLTTIVAVIVLFIGITYVLKLTNILSMYSIPVEANKPTLNPGDHIWASKLIKDKFYKFICFEKPGVPLSVFRCIGIPGDIIEIKSGVIFRNGQSLIEQNVWNEFIINKSQLDKIAGFVEKKQYPLTNITDSTYSLTISQKELQQYNLNLKRFIVNKDSVNEMISKAFPGTKYNEDNFGPVKLPQHNYFVLGDNRHNAADSRYIGFVDENQIKAIVLNK